MSSLLIKTEVRYMDGEIGVQISQSQNVMHEGNGISTGDQCIYKDNDGKTILCQYTTTLQTQKLDESSGEHQTLRKLAPIAPKTKSKRR